MQAMVLESNRSICVIDYGAGNLHNICRLIKQLGYRFSIVEKPENLNSYDALFLPGVGSYSYAMKSLKTSGLEDLIREFKATERPLIGICAGMQILSTYGEEGGKCSGFNFIPGHVRLMSPQDNGEKLRLPHIGWSKVKDKRTGQTQFAYFAHSYLFDIANINDGIAFTDFGCEVIPAVVGRENITGIQFHPEISHDYGRQLIVSLLN